MKEQNIISSFLTTGIRPLMSLHIVTYALFSIISKGGLLTLVSTTETEQRVIISHLKTAKKITQKI